MTTPAWALAAAATLLLAVPAVVWRVAAGRAAQAEVSAWLSPGLVRDVEGQLTRVTGELLRSDDYYVRLEGVTPGAAPVRLDRYDFRVLRP